MAKKLNSKKLRQRDGETDSEFSLRKAKMESAAREDLKRGRDRQITPESPIMKFRRCFDGA